MDYLDIAQCIGAYTSMLAGAGVASNILAYYYTKRQLDAGVEPDFIDKNANKMGTLSRFAAELGIRTALMAYKK